MRTAPVTITTTTPAWPHGDQPLPISTPAVTPTGMTGTLRLLRLFGFDILVHWSLPIVALLVTWSLASGYLAGGYPAWSAGQRWLVGAGTALLVFASLLIHELAHALLARRRGVPVDSITLYLFGGVAALGDEPQSARDEFAIAVVGPLTSLGLALLCAGIWVAVHLLAATSLAGTPLGSAPVAAVSGLLALINLVDGLFNLVPGMPLDGGRMLRAGLWGVRGDLHRATRHAAIAGRVVAAGLLGLGVLSLVGVSILAGVWLIALGGFLWDAAARSSEQGVFVSTPPQPLVSDLVDVAPPPASLSAYPHPHEQPRASAHAPSTMPAVRLQRVMVPLDGSPLAEAVLPFALRLAQGFDATLVLVRAEPWINDVAPPYGHAPDDIVREREIAAEASAYLARVQRQVGDAVRVETRLLRGIPTWVLLDMALHQDIDVVVMSTYGRSGWRRLLLGSVADQLVRSGVPTFVLRSPLAAVDGEDVNVDTPPAVARETETGDHPGPEDHPAMPMR